MSEVRGQSGSEGDRCVRIEHWSWRLGDDGRVGVRSSIGGWRPDGGTLRGSDIRELDA